MGSELSLPRASSGRPARAARSCRARARLAGVTSTVVRTGRTARLDDYSNASGHVGEYACGTGVRSVVAAPVVVDGRTWGVLAGIWTDRGPPPEDTEDRLAGFAELLDTAIANADSRDQLTASRARVLAAGDQARRRVVRDLHDGAQQRLVHTIITLKLAKQALREDRSDADKHLAEASAHRGAGDRKVAELARGHPARGAYARRATHRRGRVRPATGSLRRP
jgi:GAF domain-containing protein